MLFSIRLVFYYKSSFSLYQFMIFSSGTSKLIIRQFNTFYLSPSIFFCSKIIFKNCDIGKGFDYISQCYILVQDVYPKRRDPYKTHTQTHSFSSFLPSDVNNLCTAFIEQKFASRQMSCIHYSGCILYSVHTGSLLLTD